MGTIHKSQAQLARALGFTPPALAKWRTNFPESCPQTFDVTEWRKFIAENGLGFRRDKPIDNRELLNDLHDNASAALAEMRYRITAMDDEAGQKFADIHKRWCDLSGEIENLVEAI